MNIAASTSQLPLHDGLQPGYSASTSSRLTRRWSAAYGRAPHTTFDVTVSAVTQSGCARQGAASDRATGSCYGCAWGAGWRTRPSCPHRVPGWGCACGGRGWGFVEVRGSCSCCGAGSCSGFSGGCGCAGGTRATGCASGCGTGPPGQTHPSSRCSRGPQTLPSGPVHPGGCRWSPPMRVPHPPHAHTE